MKSLNKRDVPNKNKNKPDSDWDESLLCDS